MKIESKITSGVTLVSNEFIDRHLARANGEFVKVYLCLLRHEGRGEVSETFLADQLNMTERDVRRALRYFSEEGVLQFDAGSESAETDKTPVVAESAAAPELPEPAAAAPVRASYRPTEIEHIRSEHEDFAEALVAIQMYLGRTLTPGDLDRFTYFYCDLGFNGKLLEYLVEYCVSNNHRSMSYIEKTALGWHSEGKTSVEAAKAGGNRYSATNKAVMKAMGIVNRALNDKEQQFVERWSRELSMPLELIQEGCRRAVKATNKSSFEYADKVIGGWAQKGLRSLKQVSDYERERSEAAGREAAEKAEKAEKARKSQSASKKNFDFEQRHFDYDAILRQEA